MRQKKWGRLTYKHRTRILKFTQSYSSLNTSWKIWIFHQKKMPVSMQTTLVGPQIPWRTWVPQNKKARPRKTKKAKNIQSQSHKKGAKSTCRWSMWQSFPVSSQTNFNTGGVLTTSDRSRHRRSILWPWLKGHTASRVLSIEFSQAHFQWRGSARKHQVNYLPVTSRRWRRSSPLSSVISWFIWHTTTPGWCLKNRNWDPHHMPLSSFFPQSLKTGKERFPLFFFLFLPSKCSLFKMEWSSLPKETFPMLKEK